MEQLTSQPGHQYRDVASSAGITAEHQRESEMCMRLRALAAAILAGALVLASACGAKPADQSNSDSSAATSSSAATTDASTSGTATTSAAPEEPADTEIASPVSAGDMPTATGKFGDKPTITVPSTPAPDSLQRVVLSDGDGPEVKATDTVVVNYLGQVWGGDVFDNSYDRGVPFATQIGGAQRQVVAGWDVGLKGVKQGSRVLLSFPARDGYGAAGSPPKIPGGASLIFVVDVVTVYPVDAAGQTDAAPQQIPAGWPTVGGELGTLPTIAVPKSLPPPADPGMTLVAKGTGKPAQTGDVMVQYVATAWDGSHTEQSWPDPTGKDPQAGTGPQAFPLSASSPFAVLLGAPIGSRVLLRTPADSKTGVPAVAWVVDLIAQKNVTAGS
jgi:peptidylprolyl isomerase